MCEQKDITQSIITFRKSGDGYNVFILMRGYSITPNTKQAVRIHESIPLGYCSGDDLENTIDFFRPIYSDFQVIENDVTNS